MKVVITGGGGFVGRYLVDELMEAWPEAVVEIWDLPEVDITKRETYEEQLVDRDIDWIVHLAAVSSVPAGLKDPEAAFAVNTAATEELLFAVKETTPDTKVFVASTSDIYGQGSDTPLPELPLSKATPSNPYAKSKWEMEHMIEEKFNDRVLRVRPFPHIGPGQKQGFVTADFASQIAAIEKGNQDPVMKVGNLEASRDFTDVRDVVRAYRLLLEKGELGQVYHVASGTAVTIQWVLDTLLSYSTTSISVEQDSERMRPSDVPVLVGDASKLSDATGWKPDIELTQTLQDILEWWREQS